MIADDRRSELLALASSFPTSLDINRFNITCRALTVFGSSPDGTVASPNSARCHRRRLGETSRRHLSSGELPNIWSNLLSNSNRCLAARLATMTDEFRHEPVMLTEVLGVFADIAPGLFVDATLGGAGHSVALLTDHSAVRLLGIDRDENALRAAATALGSMSGRATLRHARFDHIAELVAATGESSVVGALFDLGVSSPQFDVAERGFSYRHDAPLDMRMDQSQTTSAFHVVNNWNFEELVAMLQDNADEKFATRIARAIIAARPIEKTVQLADVVTMAIPAAARRRGGHPAKRTFQAIRIAVNNELEILESSLEATINLLAPRARLAVLTYHSGEDRIVKRTLRRAVTGGCTCPPGLPCGCGARPLASTIRVSRIATTVEQQANPRARSAKLRVIERLAGETI